MKILVPKSRSVCNLSFLRITGRKTVGKECAYSHIKKAVLQVHGVRVRDQNTTSAFLLNQNHTHSLGSWFPISVAVNFLVFVFIVLLVMLLSVVSFLCQICSFWRMRVDDIHLCIPLRCVAQHWIERYTYVFIMTSRVIWEFPRNSGPQTVERPAELWYMNCYSRTLCHTQTFRKDWRDQDYVEPKSLTKDFHNSKATS